ncbi:MULTISPECIES: formate/nitrite transporter family protein [Turicibacter]|jgi:formate/nitrite transporter|nr:MULTISPECIES: formate/nitrite transporter family protein [Turicibacter]MCU7191190.1 formate/nitrite transporter family protein [Turicibacter sanguinis]MCU7196356.1 formate/nitrite transporter family protein [Turicibacter sanguinis]MCU7201415.1 formate/nitrite transporter family protein [Turicibacter sanguinis]MCU7211028.1 formate/nitrite transporter family protein [Turicibacter sanguinis]MDB8436543.1 formate/nitrite transporter family protein [Turicibacter sanguinis]
MQQMLAPKEIAEATVGVGKYKTSKKNSIVFVSAMLAGLFIGLGYTGYLIVSGIMADAAVGKVVGALLFPVGLLLVLIAGADLFTGNTLVTMAWYKKEIKLGDVAKNLSIVWLGNLVGALFLVVLVYYSNTFTGSIAEGVMHLAEKKVHLNMVELLTRSTLCNILVAITVYMSYAAKDVTGKVIISYIPIWLFVITGFEHCVANMFVLPMGYLLGADLTIGQIMANIIPVTIGNIIGGMLVTAAYYFLFLKDKDHH